MAVVRFIPHPVVPSSTRYTNFGNWLHENFFDHLCSYCLTKHSSLNIDHYEPQKYAPDKIDNPDNLLLACQKCNGAGGKSDYHPLHSTRRRLPKDRTGHLVLDVRTDNFGELFALDASSGQLRVKPGPTAARAAWNAVTLLNLDLDYLNQYRGRLLEKLLLCEKLIIRLGKQPKKEEPETEACLHILTKELAEQWLFFFAFYIDVSPQLAKRIAHHRPAFCLNSPHSQTELSD